MNSPKAMPECAWNKRAGRRVLSLTGHVDGAGCFTLRDMVFECVLNSVYSTIEPPSFFLFLISIVFFKTVKALRDKVWKVPLSNDFLWSGVLVIAHKIRPLFLNSCPPARQRKRDQDRCHGDGRRPRPPSVCQGLVTHGGFTGFSTALPVRIQARPELFSRAQFFCVDIFITPQESEDNKSITFMLFAIVFFCACACAYVWSYFVQWIKNNLANNPGDVVYTSLNWFSLGNIFEQTCSNISGWAIET